MFYISIPKRVLDDVMEEAKSTDNEIIGILMGGIDEHTIVIEEAISGEQESASTHATLPPKTIAEVTDKILKGEIKGRIVGWYHSHPGFGLFMSQTDINTQKNLQQFSSKVTALIVDPEDEDFGFFTLHDPEGVVQLGKEQVHVYDEDEEKIPKSFSTPPKVPKPILKRSRKFAVPMPEPAAGPNVKLIALAASVALICMMIAAMIFYRNIPPVDSEHSSVNNVLLFGESQRNQEGISIFRDMMEIKANVTIVEDKITGEGVRFYLGLEGQAWRFMDNVTTALNGTYTLIFDTKSSDDGKYQIKVNFTDTSNSTWQKISDSFIIDNIPDVPKPRFLDPRDGDILDGIVTIFAEVSDIENNVYGVWFYYCNATGNWSVINETQQDKFVYVVNFDTNQLPNGTYFIRVSAEDRNLYMDEDVITVNILHG